MSQFTMQQLLECAEREAQRRLAVLRGLACFADVPTSKLEAMEDKVAQMEAIAELIRPAAESERRLHEMFRVGK